MKETWVLDEYVPFENSEGRFVVLFHSIGQDSLGALSPLSSGKQSVRHGVSHTQATEACFFVCTDSHLTHPRLVLSHSTAKTDRGPLILLPPPPKRWDYLCVPLCRVDVGHGLNTESSQHSSN